MRKENPMTTIELIETINPPADAMVRTFHCHVCNCQHLQDGPIARIWINYQEGYAANAHPDCVDAAAIMPAYSS